MPASPESSPSGIFSPSREPLDRLPCAPARGDHAVVRRRARRRTPGSPRGAPCRGWRRRPCSRRSNRRLTQGLRPAHGRFIRGAVNAAVNATEGRWHEGQGSLSARGRGRRSSPPRAALAAVIDGTPGDDRLRGTMNADVIRAFAGNDFVNARDGNDLVRAGRRRRRRAGRQRQRHRLRRRRATTGSARARQRRCRAGAGRASDAVHGGDGPRRAARRLGPRHGLRRPRRRPPLGRPRRRHASRRPRRRRAARARRRRRPGHAPLRAGSRHGEGARAPSGRRPRSAAARRSS